MGSDSRIYSAFENARQQRRAALILYLMAGDPDMQTTLEIMHMMAESGADIIELGMPFSDPAAEGPTIQAAGARSLKSGGSTSGTIEIVRKFRERNNTTPIIMMGYYNPIYSYGNERFVRDAVSAGADGAIIVDLPSEEQGQLTQYMGDDFSLINLIAPTTTKERKRKILHNASGFVYYVSIAGITGTKSADGADVAGAVEEIRQCCDLPVAVGFGIKNPQHVQRVAVHADGVVVGSEVVRHIAQISQGQGRGEVLGQLRNFIRNLHNATIRQ